MFCLFLREQSLVKSCDAWWRAGRREAQPERGPQGASSSRESVQNKRRRKQLETETCKGRGDESMGKIYLFRMVKLFEDAVVVGPRDPFGKADCHLDVGLEWALEDLIHFAVVVVVVPDTEHALNIIPNSRSKPRRIHVFFRAHRIVR